MQDSKKVSVFKGVSSEDSVFCGPPTAFTNGYNTRAEIAKMDQLHPTFVLMLKSATIGAGALITPDIPILSFIMFSHKLLSQLHNLYLTNIIYKSWIITGSLKNLNCDHSKYI